MSELQKWLRSGSSCSVHFSASLTLLFLLTFVSVLQRCWAFASFTLLALMVPSVRNRIRSSSCFFTMYKPQPMHHFLWVYPLGSPSSATVAGFVLQAYHYAGLLLIHLFPCLSYVFPLPISSLKCYLRDRKLYLVTAVVPKPSKMSGTRESSKSFCRVKEYNLGRQIWKWKQGNYDELL